MPTPDHQHTFVVVFLRGGADTLNILVPHADDTYYKLRPTLAIDRPGKGVDSAIDLDGQYGLHPAMRGLEGAFKEGELGFVQGVGCDNTSGSHFECQDQMEHGGGIESPESGGWIGRYLRLREASGHSLSPLSAIALSGMLPESLRGAPTATALLDIKSLGFRIPHQQVEDATVRALRRLYRPGTEDPLLSQGADSISMVERLEELKGQEYLPEAGVEYPEDDFGSGLQQIARLCKADLGLHVACIDLPGWDSHFVQGSANGFQADRIKALAEGLTAFHADTQPVKKHVTTLVMTEFGRRLYENASLGTDHGRGFAAMLLGAGVQGGKVYGDWPSVIEMEDSGGPGGLQIQTDYRGLLGGMLGLVAPGSGEQIFSGVKGDGVGIFG